MKDVLKALNEYRRLEVNWDGEGAVKPTEKAISEAEAFYEANLFELESPQTQLSNFGVVGFYWDLSSPNVYADIEFCGDGLYSVFVRNQDKGEDIWLDYVPVQIPPVTSIAEILSKK